MGILYSMLDDDDEYLPNAFEIIRKYCIDEDTLYIFALKYRTLQDYKVFKNEITLGYIGYSIWNYSNKIK